MRDAEQLSSREQRHSERQRVRFLHRRWQALLFALAASMLSLATYWYQQNYHPRLLESIDMRTRDVVFNLRPTAPVPPPEVAIVAIDELSVKEYGRWPWPRALQGKLIQAIKQQGAGTVALDIVFARNYASESEGETQDRALIEALQAPGAPVVGGYFFRADITGEVNPEALEQLMDNRVKRQLVAPGGRTDTVIRYNYVEVNQPHIAQHLDGLGSFNRYNDVDGLIRRAPLVIGYNDELFPTLALRALAVYTGMGEGIVASPEGLTEVRLGTFAVPVDSYGLITADFYDTNNPIPIYSAADVLDGRVGANQLADRLIFVGITEVGIGDLIPTPVDDLFPGVAMHATVAANIIQGDHLYNNLDTMIIDILMIVFIPLVTVLVVMWLNRPALMLLAFTLIALGLAALFYYIVAYRDHLVSLIYPFAAMLTAFVAWQIYYVMTTQRTTKFLTGAFSSYVSPELVQVLLKQPGQLGLSGEKRNVTLLFSDIRGFTTISESLEPERLVAMLNRYFDAMTDTILERKGTLDKYIGDAVMAIFNAPLNIDRHQHQAARSALAMIDRLEAMSGDLKEIYGVDLKIGVGLHSGEAVVGNLGSSERFDYTAIGDVVNLASRVEGISKIYGVNIVITQSIEEHLEESFVRRPLDLIQVKGKTEPIKIYELMASEEASRPLAQATATAFELYMAGEFQHAATAYRNILQSWPEDGPATLMLARAEAFIEIPPEGDWDGVFRATHK